MKKCLLLLVLMTGSSGADIVFTNRSATITNRQGQVYERIQLVRADAEAITYRMDGGGGRIFYTNLSPTTLESLGLSADRASAALESAKQEVFRKDQMDSQELKRMADPANWQTVHLTGYQHVQAGAGGWRWTVAEIPGYLIIQNVPARTTRFYNAYCNAVATINELNRQADQRADQATSLQPQIDSLSQSVTAQENRLQQLNAAVNDYNSLIAGTSGDQLYVKPTYVMQVEAARERLNQMRRQMRELKNQQDTFAAQAREAETQLRQFVNEQGKDVNEIQVFVTGRKYYGSTVLLCTGQ